MAKLTNDVVAWDEVDHVLLDMDGTLLDLRFDTGFWMQVVPRAYARAQERPLDDIMPTLRLAFDSQRGTLSWYNIDYWAKTLDLDVMSLQQQYREHIAWLDGAPAFLDALRASGKQATLVTNADRKTLTLKDEQTGLIAKLDAAVSSHDFGRPKEHPEFWPRFFAEHEMDPARVLFVDDTLTVLNAARAAGIGQVVAIAKPDSSGPVRDMGDFPAVEGVAALCAPAT